MHLIQSSSRILYVISLRTTLWLPNAASTCIITQEIYIYISVWGLFVLSMLLLTCMLCVRKIEKFWRGHGRGPPTPKILGVPKTRFFDRTLQKNENWKNYFFGGWGPHPTPYPPTKIGIDPLAYWSHSVQISYEYEHGNSKYTPANLQPFIKACRGT